MVNYPDTHKKGQKQHFLGKNYERHSCIWSGNGNERSESGNGVEMKKWRPEWNWNGVEMKNFENAHHWSEVQHK